MDKKRSKIAYWSLDLESPEAAFFGSKFSDHSISDEISKSISRGFFFNPSITGDNIFSLLERYSQMINNDHYFSSIEQLDEMSDQISNLKAVVQVQIPKIEL